MSNRQAKIISVANRDEAQALANLLWNERERHKDDIRQINTDLRNLKRIWNIIPHGKRIFMTVIKEER